MKKTKLGAAIRHILNLSAHTPLNLTPKLTETVKARVSGQSFAAGTAVMALALSIPAYANSVISQAPIGNNTTNSFVSSYTNGSLTEQWVFDNFIPSQSATITNVTWQGTAQPVASQYDTTNGFVIAIYDRIPMTDPEVSTTKPIYTATILGNAGQKANANGLYDFSANLPTPYTITAGKSYWITIYAKDQAPYLTWGWNMGSGGMAAGTSSDPNCPSGTCTVIVGQNYIPVAGGHRAFSLNDTAVTATLSTGEVGVAYNGSLTGVNSTNSLSVTGSVPPGLTVNIANGTLSGTPTTAGPYSFIVVGTATDDVFNITIDGPIAITTNSLVSGTENTAYSATIAATGGVTPYKGSVSGLLPTGLSLDPASLVLSGTPAVGTAGSYPFTVNVTDSLGAPQAQQTLTLTIGAAANNNSNSGTTGGTGATGSTSGGTTGGTGATGSTSGGTTGGTGATGSTSGGTTGGTGATGSTSGGTTGGTGATGSTSGGTTNGSSNCPAVQNTLNGSAKITGVEDNYIALGKTKVVFSKCTKFTFVNGATKLRLGETVTWTGGSLGGVVTATSIIVKP